MKTKYALCACLNLARMPDGKTVFISDLCREGNLPQKFLESILQDLRRAGLVRSKKGRLGGYALGRAAGAISLGEIFRATGSFAFLSGQDADGEVDEPWSEGIDEKSVGNLLMEVQRELLHILDSTTIQDLLDRWNSSEKNRVQDWVI